MPDEATIKALHHVQDQVRLDAERLIERVRESMSDPGMYEWGVRTMVSLVERAITQEFAPLFEEED